MPKLDKIRLLALGIIKQGDRLFLSRGFDPVKQVTFYRALGGGVEFGEPSIEALRREFREEIQAELTNIKYLGCIESIFTYKKQQGHEVIQLYNCDFVDDKFYQLKQIDFKEKDRQKTALWLSIEKCKTGEFLVVPEKFLDFIC
jgi:8-oxo-dGTP pyrophosphatase MutT (NUDIX family)